MSDAELREEERLVSIGAASPERLERARCRAGQHCGCRRTFVDRDPEVVYRGQSVWGYQEASPTFVIEDAVVVIHFHRPAPGVDSVEERVQAFLANMGLLPARSPADDPLEFECPSCKAERGRRCVTRTGKRATEPHRPRINTSERVPTTFQLFSEDGSAEGPYEYFEDPW